MWGTTKIDWDQKQSDAGAAKKYGDWIHSDLWGPVQVSSIGRSCYFVTFTDEATVRAL
jgi:hypothetical protein